LGSAIGFALVIVVSSLASASIGGTPAVVEKAKGPLYNVTFNEVGLPTGTNWSVHVAFVGCGCEGVRTTVTSDGNSITIGVTNGTYKYTIERVTGYYVNGSAHGELTMSGTALPPVNVSFNPVVPYVAEFVESGLPTGTNWTVSVVGNGHGQEAKDERQTETSNTTTMNFTLPNATYHYTVSKVDGSFFTNGTQSGKFVVAGASPAPVRVTWITPPTFALTFTESGLPSGTNWSVAVAGFGGTHISEVTSSTGTSLSFALPNGTYHYTVAEVLGFVVNGSIRGGIVITDAAVDVNVSFLQVAEGAFYPVAFEENGLPGGHHWAVTVTATHTFGHSRSETQTSKATTDDFLLQNGTYRYSVHGVQGYVISTGGSGTFAITGSSPSVIIVNFTAIPTYTVTFNETGLANGTNWSVLLRSQSASSTPWPIHLVLTESGASISFTVPNGTYCFKFYSVPGYRVTSGSATGSLTVAGGSPPATTIGFTPRA
jgi:hypothetical protein